MNYKQAKTKLATPRNKQSKKLANNTYLERRGENIAIRLHQTDIIIITPKNHYILNNGDWFTPTTKSRLNDYLPCYITQSKGIWYLGNGSLYYNGMELNSKGNPVKPKNPKKTEGKKSKLDKMVSKYIKGFVQDVNENGLNDPNGGDCWHCCLKGSDGQNLGQLSSNYDHIINHIEESYFVPSLLWDAVQRYNQPQYIWSMMKTNSDIVGRELRSYFMKLKPQLIKHI